MPSILTDRFDELRQLAIAAGASKFTVYKWRTRGIPFKWHSRLLAEAERQGVALSREDLEATQSG